MPIFFVVLIIIGFAIGLNAHGPKEHDAPYTTSQVRQAFGAAGFHLAQRQQARGDHADIRASFDAGGGIEVAVYRPAARGVHFLIGWTGYEPPAIKHARNVVVVYPKHTRMLPSIRRALVLLGTGQ